MRLAVKDGLLSFSLDTCCSALLEVLGRIFGFFFNVMEEAKKAFRM